MPAGGDVHPGQQGGERPGRLLHERPQALPGHDQALVGEQRYGQADGIPRRLVLLDEVGLAGQALARPEHPAGDLVAEAVRDLLVPRVSHLASPSEVPMILTIWIGGIYPPRRF